jgi:hypothetical protein
MYRRIDVVSSIARQQQNRQNGYHGYHHTEPQGVIVAYLGYDAVPMATKNAAVTSLDSKWTPRRHFSEVGWLEKTAVSL